MSFVAALLLLSSSTALASEGHHEEHPTWVVGLRGVYSLEFHPGEAAHRLGGFGASLGWLAIPEWLEVELGVAVLFGDEGVRHLPVELAFLKPFEVGPIEVAVGLGPLVEIGFHHEDTHVAWGGCVDGEIVYWIAPWAGLKLGAMVELKSEEGEFVQEIATLGGPVLGW